jgi:hypothetical protein
MRPNRPSGCRVEGQEYGTAWSLRLQRSSQSVAAPQLRAITRPANEHPITGGGYLWRPKDNQGAVGNKILQPAAFSVGGKIGAIADRAEESG